MNIQELKEKSSEKLITEAEKLGIENASTLRRQEIYFAILVIFLICTFFMFKNESIAKGIRSDPL